MLDLIRLGGVPAIFVVLFGLVALVGAILFAVKPDPKKVATIKALSLATLASIIAGAAAALAAVFLQIPNNPEFAQSPDLHLIVMVGLGESMSSPILGGAILSLVWMVMAVGERRFARVA